MAKREYVIEYDFYTTDRRDNWDWEHRTLVVSSKKEAVKRINRINASEQHRFLTLNGEQYFNR